MDFVVSHLLPVLLLLSVFGGRLLKGGFAAGRAEIVCFAVMHGRARRLLLVYIHSAYWIFCHKRILLSLSSHEICVHYILLEHSLRVKKRSVESNTVEHDFNEAVAIMIEKRNNRVFEFFVKGRGVF